MPLALYTFGQFARPSEDPANDGFHALNDPVFARVDAAPGLVARSGYPDEPEGPESWGPQVYPGFWQDNGDGWSPSTLSLWRDAASAHDWIYGGLHARAMAQGRKWFVEPRWPPYVLWWHRHETCPTWAEGVARIEALHAQGPSPEAFTFREALRDRGPLAEA